MIVDFHGSPGVCTGDTIGPGRFDGWFAIEFGFGFGTSTSGAFGLYVHQLITCQVRSIFRQASGTTVKVSSVYVTASSSQSSPKNVGSP